MTKNGLITCKTRTRHRNETSWLKGWPMKKEKIITLEVITISTSHSSLNIPQL